MTGTSRRCEERLIGALVPRPLPRASPPPAVVPVLPARHLPADSDGVLLDVVRLDRSGRLSARSLLRGLGWRTGHRVDIDVIDTAITITSAPTGRHAVGGRGDLALPAAPRHLCGIDTDQAVVLAAYPSAGVLVVHPAATVARLLADLHHRLFLRGSP
jgi:hypothetical protein